MSKSTWGSGVEIPPQLSDGVTVTGDPFGSAVEIESVELSVVPNFYALKVQKGGFWRIAAVDTHVPGAGMRFRAAALLRDGTIRLETRSLGRQRRTRKVTLDPQRNLWSTECTHVLPGRGTVITSASGRFGAGTEATLTRVLTDPYGRQVWRAQATMRLVDGDDGRVRQTSGTATYANGDTGSFVTTVNAIGNGTSSFEIARIGKMPEKWGSNVVHNPDGSITTFKYPPMPGHDHQMDSNTVKQIPQSDGSTRVENTVQHTHWDSNGHITEWGSSWVTTSRDLPTSNITGDQHDSQIERTGTERDTQGNKTQVHEIITVGPHGETSEIWHRDNPDGTHETQIISSENGERGTRETTVVDKNGHTVSEKHEDVELDQSGDWSPVPSGGSSPDPDPDPDSGSGEDHPSTGEESQADDTGDGGFGDDSGPPGLGWDGLGDSPRHLLPDGSADDGTAGWGGELDTLGAAMGIGLARILLTAWNRPGGAEGLGEDVTGIATTIPLDPSGFQPHSVADPDGNWGDFTNPKAHLDLLQAVQLGRINPDAPPLTIGSLSALGSALLD